MARSEARLKYPTREQASAFSPENDTPFKCAVIGTTFPIKNYNIPGKEIARTLKMSFVLEGDGEIMLDGVWRPVSAGDVFLLSPKMFHNYRSLSDTPFHTLWISYHAEYIGQYLEVCGVTAGVYHLPELQKNFEQLYKFAEQSTPSPYVYFEITERIHKIIHTIGMSLLTPEDDDCEKIHSLLNTMIYQKADLDAIATQLHMSKSNVIRLFKKRFGVTPHQHLLTQKIDAAKLLLRSTTISIKEISEKLCISDEHYFSTLFHKHTGTTPKEYRKTH
jgi:AraC-like DNA-binding protein